jgi:putative endonuclease
MYVVYIIECADRSLYTGITNDLARRFKQHQSGAASRYTSAKRAVKVVYTEERPNRSSALKREAQIKAWRRGKKLELVRSKKQRA